jgi:hypothetical protein
MEKDHVRVGGNCSCGCAGSIMREKRERWEVCVVRGKSRRVGAEQSTLEAVVPED